MTGSVPDLTVDAEPPFFRGEDESLLRWCDFLLESGSCCDEPPRYAVWWTSIPGIDGDTTPVSSVCVEHVLQVDRNLVDRMATHPLADRNMR